MNYFKDCKTLDEAKKHYWELAKIHHPDMGGDKANFQEILNQFQSYRPGEEKFKGETDEWNSEEYSHIIEALLNLQDIDIEICGSWIWLSGDTKTHKEEIKAIETGESYRRGYSKQKKMWYFSPKGYRKKSKSVMDMDSIRDAYGSQFAKKRREEEEQKRLKTA